MSELLPPSDVPDPDDPTLALAQNTLRDLLEKMSVTATLATAWGPVDEDGTRPLTLSLEGAGLEFLIGPKGEVLDALQMIVRLLIGKQLNDGVNVIVDVQGHKHRREEQIRRLARRMAEQATRLKRTMALEPMPASERRLVHIELRDDPHVRTESTGEGNRRKVTIIPK
jgi:spoIIIJ-associated protein